MSITPDESKKFKFTGFFPVILVLALLVATCFAAAIAIFTTEGHVGSSAFFIFVSFFLLLIGSIFLIGNSDIIVNDEGISRSIFGRRIQHISWTKVERIVTYPARAAGVSRDVTAYNLFSAPGASQTRKIYFSNQSTNLVNLIVILNVYIERYQIRVECTSDHGKVVVNSL